MILCVLVLFSFLFLITFHPQIFSILFLYGKFCFPCHNLDGTVFRIANFCVDRICFFINFHHSDMKRRQVLWDSVVSCSHTFGLDNL